MRKLEIRQEQEIRHSPFPPSSSPSTKKGGENFDGSHDTTITRGETKISGVRAQRGGGGFVKINLGGFISWNLEEVLKFWKQQGGSTPDYYNPACKPFKP